jgi:Holliday junction resolvasome RuvABC ATP-dependent DNA helicase subunit
MSQPQSIFIDNTELSETNQLLLLSDDSFVTDLDSIFKYPQDLTKTIDERAELFFPDIIGHTAIKRQLYRALLRDNRLVNILLIGAPANAKTLFMKCIERQCNGVIFYDASTGSSGAGLIEILRLNPQCKILIIDELAELKRNDIEVLRGLANDGRVSKTLKKQFINFRIENLKIFGTTNNPTKLSKPIKSRFQIYLIPEYTDQEFKDVVKFCLKKQNIIKDDTLINELAHAMIHFNIKNIRNALACCSLVHEGDNYEVIKRTIMEYIENDGSKCNTNFNEE